MNKMVNDTFIGDTITEVPKEKTRAEKNKEWMLVNKAAFERAQHAHMCCTPSRADAFLVETYSNGGPF
jgi:hypothetical protein